jgi:hypothetical protein
MAQPGGHRGPFSEEVGPWFDFQKVGLGLKKTGSKFQTKLRHCSLSQEQLVQPVNLANILESKKIAGLGTIAPGDYTAYLVERPDTFRKGFTGDERNRRTTFKLIDESFDATRFVEGQNKESFTVGCRVLVFVEFNFPPYKIAEVTRVEPQEPTGCYVKFLMDTHEHPVEIPWACMRRLNSVLLVRTCDDDDLRRSIDSLLQIQQASWRVQVERFRIEQFNAENFELHVDNDHDRAFICDHYTRTPSVAERTEFIDVVYENREMYVRCQEAVRDCLRRSCLVVNPAIEHPDFANVPEICLTELLSTTLGDSVVDSILDKLRCADSASKVFNILDYGTSFAKITMRELVAISFYTFSLFVNCQENCSTIAIRISVIFRRIRGRQGGDAPLADQTGDDLANHVRALLPFDWFHSCSVARVRENEVEMNFIIRNDRTSDGGYVSMQEWVAAPMAALGFNWQKIMGQPECFEHAKSVQCPTCHFSSERHSLYHYFRLFKNPRLFNHAFHFIEPFSQSYSEGISKIPVDQPRCIWKGFTRSPEMLRFVIQAHGAVPKRLHEFNLDATADLSSIVAQQKIILSKNESFSTDHSVARRYAVPKTPAERSTIFEIEQPAALDIDPLSVVPFLAPKCKELEVNLPERTELLFLGVNPPGGGSEFQYNFRHLIDVNASSEDHLRVLVTMASSKSAAGKVSFVSPDNAPEVARRIIKFRKYFPNYAYFDMIGFNKFLDWFCLKVSIPADFFGEFGTLGSTAKRGEFDFNELDFNVMKLVSRLPLPTLWPLVAHMTNIREARDFAGSPQKNLGGCFVEKRKRATILSFSRLVLSHRGFVFAS